MSDKIGVNVQELLAKGMTEPELFELAQMTARNYIYKLRNQGQISFSEPRQGEIPSIHVVRRTIPEAWESTTMALLGIGNKVHTGYDPEKNGKYISFPSLEGTVTMHIEEPFSEPQFHRNYLGGYLGIGDYIAEIEGVKDHWVISPSLVADMIRSGKSDEIKDFKGWKYSYSQRFRAFPFIDVHGNPQTINQFDSIIRKLTKEPLSKSAQCTTWDPRFDHNDNQMNGFKFDDYDSPCLQKLWFRLVPLSENKEEGYKLNFNILFRSRDHLKAVPQNQIGILNGMYEHVRKSLEKELKVPVKRARLVDISDSLHLYGHYLDPRMQGLDAQQYLQDIFRVAEGQPIENRLVLPGTPLYEVYQEEIDTEYKRRIQNPDLGKPDTTKLARVVK